MSLSILNGKYKYYKCGQELFVPCYRVVIPIYHSKYLYWTIQCFKETMNLFSWERKMKGENKQGKPIKAAKKNWS